MTVIYEQGEKFSPMENYNVNRINIENDCNLPNGILRPAKHAKNVNSLYFTILQVYMNNRNGRANFNNLTF